MWSCLSFILALVPCHTQRQYVHKTGEQIRCLFRSWSELMRAEDSGLSVGPRPGLMVKLFAAHTPDQKKIRDIFLQKWDNGINKNSKSYI